MAYIPSRSQTSVRVRLPPHKYQSKGPQLKNKVWIYFQKASGGCKVEDVNIVFANASGLWMVVTFVEPSGVRQALAKRHHEMEIDGGFLTSLEVYPDELPPVKSPQDVENISQHSACNQSSLSYRSDQTMLSGHSSNQPDKIGGHSNDDVQEEYSVPLCQRGVGIDEQDELSEDWGSDDDDDDDEDGDDGGDDDDDDDDDSPCVDPEFDEDQLCSSSGEDESQDSEGEDDELVVEVTDFKPSTSDEMLRLYFETPRKSGGGDLKTFDHDPKTGAIILTFENPSVARTVTARSHRVEGAALSVRQIVKKKPRPRPVKKRCLLLSGIPDGCDAELVTMFIDTRSGIDEFDIQYGEMRRKALCTFTEDIPDMEVVIKRICKKKLQGSFVTAEKVHESDSILVQGVSPKAPLEMIELYFDNKKKSGGTGVRDVQQGPTDTQAIVYFDDWRVVGDVLSRRGTHKVGGTELLVEEYHECLGRLSLLDVPTPHVPKPVTVQVQEPIMEFIFGKGQHTKKTLIQKLRDAKAILKWPDGDDKTTARLEPLLEGGQRQSSRLKWSETAIQVLTEFLNRCKSSRIAVPPPFWKDFIGRINQLNTKSFSIQHDASTHLVTLVGEQQDVDKGCTDVNKIIKELKAKPKHFRQKKKGGILTFCRCTIIQIALRDKNCFGLSPTDTRLSLRSEAMAYIPTPSHSQTSIRLRLPLDKYQSKGPQLKNQIWTYFQKDQVSGGCEVEDVNIVFKDDGGVWMTVAFAEPSGVQQALAQTRHELEIDGFLTSLEIHPDELCHQDESISSVHSNLESYLESFIKSNVVVESIGNNEQNNLGEDGGSDDDDDDSSCVDPEFDEDQLSSSSGENDFSDSEGEDDELVVEVTDFKPSTSDEMLRLYFETPSKSGGGDLKTFERNPKTSVIMLTFDKPSVARSVTARSHRVNGAALSVRQIVKEKPRPRPVKKRCLFLSGIPDGCNSELVTMFIENRSGTDEFKIQYGEMPRTAICTFTEDITDAEGVIKRISTKKLQGSFVTTEQLKESDSILVQGVSPKASLEMIELYFDNKKKSGGTGVREVQQGPTDTQAIVYFQDWKVVGDVLSKRGAHKVGGTELLVEEYHECLGRLSPLDAPTPHVPKPVTVQVQEPIMEFIFGKGQHTKKTLTQKLRDAKAILKWPDGDDKTTASLEPLLEDGQRQPSWLKWSETATQVLTDFLNRCKSSRIAVPPRFWKDVIEIIDKFDTKSFSIQLDASTHLVTLVGEQQDVDNGRSDIKGVIEELRAKAENEDQQIKVDILLTDEKSQPFIKCGIKDQTEKDFPNLRITVIPLQDEVTLIFEGSSKIVQEAELSMRRQMDSLEKVEIKIGRNKVKFVQNHTDKIHEILGSQGIRAACNGSDDGKIIILGATKKDMVQAKAYINQEIEEDVIPIKDQTVLSVLKSQEGRDLLDEANQQKFTVVNISEREDMVELAGFKTSLVEVKQNIQAFLAKNVINKDFINMSKSKMDVLLKRYGKSLDSWAKQHEHNHMKIAPESGSRTGILIQGNEEGLMIARRFVNSLADGIEDPSPSSSSESDEQELLQPDVAMKVVKQVPPVAAKPRKKVRSLKASPDKREAAEMAMMMVTDQSASVSLPPQATPVSVSTRPDTFQRFASMTPRQVHVSPRQVHVSPRQVHVSPYSGTFVTRERMQISVCQGDITKQSVSAVVNPTDPALRNAGGVSRALASAAGAPLQKHCLDMMKSRPNNVLNITECILTPGFNLNCLIIHAVGPGKNGPNFSNELQDTFLNCLLKAEENEVRSLAVPLIGSGSAGSPKDVCADALVSALLKFSSQSSMNLRDVQLVNIDHESCVAITQALQNSGLHATSMP
ncbi:uncharacterized protein LOC119740105 [Patiria miniata]|uniref:Macro domain-containing protein n=1 Tax=Patiria miniata TaxID=46514 RepID=A0A914B5L5_PATMI|nr:uncharacterized protein LOC119740105 [Patiria miniata]